MLLLLLFVFVFAGKSKDLKASIKSGRKGTDEVVDETVAAFRKRAAALKLSLSAGGPELAASVDEAVAAFEAFAAALKKDVAAGKVEGAAAVDEVMRHLESAGKELQQLSAKGGMDKAVQDLTGVCALPCFALHARAPFRCAACARAEPLCLRAQQPDACSLMCAPARAAAAPGIGVALQAVLLSSRPLCRAARPTQLTWWTTPCAP